MKLDDLFTKFIEEKKVYCSDATVTYYQNMLHRFKLFLFSVDIYDSDDINEENIKRYIMALRSSGIKNTSISTYMRGIKNFCSWGILKGFLIPFDYRVKVPRPDNDKILPLSQNEVKQIDDYITSYCSKEKMLFFHLLLDCGLRSSEALNLKYSDFDINNHIIHIRNSKYNKSRLIPCPDKIFSLISFPEDKNTFIFSFNFSGKSSFFARLKSGSGVLRVHAHLLRHTFATSYMINKGNLEYLRKYLGHSSYDVTKIYIDSAYDCQLLNYDIYKIDDIFK